MMPAITAAEEKRLSQNDPHMLLAQQKGFWEQYEASVIFSKGKRKPQAEACCSIRLILKKGRRLPPARLQQHSSLSWPIGAMTGTPPAFLEGFY